MPCQLKLSKSRYWKMCCSRDLSIWATARWLTQSQDILTKHEYIMASLSVSLLLLSLQFAEPILRLQPSGVRSKIEYYWFLCSCFHDGNRLALWLRHGWWVVDRNSTEAELACGMTQIVSISSKQYHTTMHLSNFMEYVPIWKWRK